jgi:hypothetical protein
LLTVVCTAAGVAIVKDEGPEIFVQDHLVIVPSGSAEPLPSSETLFNGKVITWSTPATDIGGLLVSAQFVQLISFWQLILNNTIKQPNKSPMNFVFFIKG